MTDGARQLEPFVLGVYFSERVWGKLTLEPWYSASFAKPVGEAWLTGESCVVQSGPHAGKRLAQMEKELRVPLLGEGHTQFPLLVKILLPQDRLSVQVHPGDADAAAMGGGARPKTECWYVLEAAPGASLSLGLKPGTTEETVRTALGSEVFEELLHEEPVVAGDMIFVEAGTVHAIGPGLVILEVQQPSDTTYRLYDYGRPRELHLEEGMKVIRLRNGSGKVSPRSDGDRTQLIDVAYFAVDRWNIGAGRTVSIQGTHTAECLVALSGRGTLIHGDARLELPIGQAVVVPASCPEYSVAGECTLVRCRVPQKLR